MTNNSWWIFDDLEEFVIMEINTTPLFMIAAVSVIWGLYLLSTTFCLKIHLTIFKPLMVFDILMIIVYILSHVGAIQAQNPGYQLRTVYLTLGHIALVNLFFLSIAIFKPKFLKLTYHKFLGMMMFFWVFAHLVTVLIGKIWQEYLPTTDPWYGFWTKNSWYGVPLGAVMLIFALPMMFTANPIAQSKIFKVFYICHIIGVLGFTFLLPWHVDTPNLLFLTPFILLVVSVVVRHLSYRKLNIMKIEAKSGISRIEVSKIPNFHPGDYIYLYIPKFGFAEAHPFTPIEYNNKTVFYIKKFNFFTKKIYEYAEKNMKFTLFNSYALPSNLRGYRAFDRIILVSGGVGSTTTLSIGLDPYISMSGGNKEVYLVMIAKSNEEVDVFKDELDELQKRGVGLRILTTRDKEGKRKNERPNLANAILNIVNGNNVEKEKSTGSLDHVVTKEEDDEDENKDKVRNEKEKESIEHKNTLKKGKFGVFFCGPPALGRKLWFCLKFKKNVCFFHETHSFEWIKGMQRCDQKIATSLF